MLDECLFHCTLGILCTLPLQPAVERALETGRCSWAASTGRSCWTVDERCGYGVVAAPGFDANVLASFRPFSLTALVLFSYAFGCVFSPPRAVGTTSGAN